MAYTRRKMSRLRAKWLKVKAIWAIVDAIAPRVKWSNHCGTKEIK